MADAKRLTVARVAKAIGVSKQTFGNWLDKPDSPRDPDAWKKVAAVLGVEPALLLDPTRELPHDMQGHRDGPYMTALPVGGNLVDLLLDILENPTETPERKATARATIRQWLRNLGA